jgi:type III restriction protein res subunit
MINYNGGCNMKNGIYEEIVNNKILKEINDDNLIIGKEKLDAEDAKNILTQYIANITKIALKYIRDDYRESEEYLLKQIEICNGIIDLLKENLQDEEFEDLKINESAEVLIYVYSKMNNTSFNNEIIRPETSISRTSLFTGSKKEPNLNEEMKKEIFSADEICMLVSFIRWSGLRTILDELKRFTESGKKLKVITTSYMGATQPKAIEELAKLQNTQIKISYDTERTRLHAKAYVFKRDSGFTTAYVGSSNMSNAAMTSGLEWNVKMSEKESFDIITKINATFETYWNDAIFENYDNSEESRNRLYTALKKNKTNENDMAFEFDIKPYAYQKEILENLQAERKVFNRNKNLVVAATGVGKTVISAFDYKKFRDENPRARLLFVAHREEILKKSRDTFRYICKDLNFGELLVGNNKPDSIGNLFVSIQSLNSSKLLERTTPDFYDYIVIDEVHHGAAKSYQKLLEFYKPKVLLGLTATPERMDGADITKYFDKRMAYEMRLPEAIDNKLLCPFQYFGVSDFVDLSKLKWTRGGYETSELENVFVLDAEIAKRRAKEIIQNTIKYVDDMDDVKALGFCVSIKHAEFMAEEFNNAGIPSVALTGNSDKELRNDISNKLISGEIKIIFTVDLFNEGVDIPQINTVLFLRPTESLTVFLQQLGRGLRICEGKDCLTALDFIGQSNKNYNFADKFRALIGKTKNSVETYVKDGFNMLPKGCFIKLEKQAKEYVLRNIKGLKNSRDVLISKMKYFVNDTGKELNLKNFLEYANVTLDEFYKSDRTFTKLKVDSEIIPEVNCKNEDFIARRIPVLLSMDSPKLIRFAIDYINNPDMKLNYEEKILLNMFYYTFYSEIPNKQGLSSEKEGILELVKTQEYRNEILEILNILYERINCVPVANSYDFINPLEVHSTYTLAQIMASYEYFDEHSKPSFREGVKYFEDKNLDIFLVTLNKSDKDFSEATLYEDYAINENLFHWQSQNRDSQESKNIQRYIHSNGRISLFVRDYKKENGITSPYMYLGECEYVNHSGNKPVSFVWKLKNSIPGKFISEANKNVL